MAASSRLRIFLASATGFGVAIAVPRIGHYPIAYVLTTSVSLGCLGGLISTWIWTRSERRLLAKGIDPGDMDPRQERTLKVRGSTHAIHEAAREALSQLHKVKIVRDSVLTGELDAKTGASWQSIGANIEIRVTGDGPSATVRITSRPRLATVIMDSGRGVENVELISRYVSKKFAGSPPNKSLDGARGG